MLVVQISSDEVDKRSTRIIKKYFKALGRLVEGIGAVGIPFNSFRDFSRDEPQRKPHLIKKWLKGRCHKLNFGHIDHGRLYMSPGILEARWGSFV